MDKQDVLKNENKLKLIADYIADRKAIVLLFLSNSVIFMVVCSLYQLHNFSKILYASIISFFVWICYGIYDFGKYIRKRRKIHMALCHPEQAVDALLYSSRDISSEQGGNNKIREEEQLTKLDKAYVGLIEELSRLYKALENEAQVRSGEMMDYYMMWAHQIKTPIAAIKLLLNEREDGFLLAEELFKIEQYVEMVLHYLRLESIASDMLLKEHDLLALVKQAVKKYSVLFINSGLTLQLEEFDAKVLTDEKWLIFVMEQILSNSLKYTKKGTISIYMQPGEQKVLVIEDTGIGIRQEDILRIFDRGFTGYNGHMDKKSTGIGLYLCKQIMSQLSHGIKVQSMEGKGTRVYLDLFRESYVERAD